MLVAPHAAAGAAIGALVPVPALALPLAVASHFVLDVVPHWQETLSPYTPTRRTWLRIPIDFVVAAGVTAILARRSRGRSLVWLSAGFGTLPDIDSLLYLIPGSKGRFALVRPYLGWHAGIQHETSSLWGLFPQIGLVLACLMAVRPDGQAEGRSPSA
ncbi:MAG TPA: hypothetical protein VF221_16765 [Chloroflexota bacterium]